MLLPKNLMNTQLSERKKLIMSNTGYTKSIGSKIFDFLLAFFMILFCISILFPLWDMLVVSLSPSNDSSTLQLNLWPKNITLDSYVFVLSDSSTLKALGVSIYRTVTGTILHIIVLTLAAFPLSKFDLPGRKILTVFFIIPMFFSGGLIPTYLAVKSYGLFDNLLVYILPGAFGVFSMLIYRNYLMSMNKALEESAYIDGANVIQVMTNIIIPLAKPVIATLALWSMVGHWNAWFDSLIYMRNQNLIVIQLVLRRMMDKTELLSDEMRNFMDMSGTYDNLTSRTVRASITIVVIFPIICTYPFLQKYFVKGIMIGAIKG